MDTFFSNLLPFISHHWLLFSALVVVILLLVLEETRTQVRGVHKISPQEAITLINRENAVIIDMRDSNAFSNGHIVNAISLPHDELEARLDKINKYKDQAIIVVCNTGQTSLTAGTKLHRKGFSKVSSITGGMQAWRNAGLPLTKT